MAGKGIMLGEVDESVPMEIDYMNRGQSSNNKGKGRANNYNNASSSNSTRGNGKPRGQGDVECFYCGKRGHMVRDCWAKNGRPGGGQGQNRRGNGSRDNRGGGARANTMDGSANVAAPKDSQSKN